MGMQRNNLAALTAVRTFQIKLTLPLADNSNQHIYSDDEQSSFLEKLRYAFTSLHDEKKFRIRAK